MRRVLAVVMLAALAGLAVVFLLPSLSGPPTEITIVSGSENKALEPIVVEWGEDNNVAVSVTYRGSVDIARELNRGADGDFDAVWPANSLWIELGDTRKVVKHAESVLRSPVVLGLRRSIAERLGWIGRDDITVEMIQAAARNDDFRLAMTSATQSNSGASAFIGFLYALAGNPDLLTMAHLGDPVVLDGVRDLLQQIDRSSGSSGWLKDALVANPDAYDAMVNYEAIVLEANQALAERGQETLYIVYPANGLSVADSPLGYVDKGDAAKEEAFQALQAHLLSRESQEQLLALGRRAGLLGLSTASVDAAVWNPAWGVDLERAIAPVPTPASDVIAEALRLYQTDLRKPSLTIWILDVSGSMEGEPLQQLKDAMGLILDLDAAALNLLQPSARDLTVVLPFSNRTLRPVIVEGSDPAALGQALDAVERLSAGGGTDLYGAIVTALRLLEPRHADGTLFDYLPAIVAMTDGASDTANRALMLQAMKESGFGRDVPIHAIAFGQADESQLRELNQATIGRLFHAGDDLAAALRKAKGYN
ncbi:MAG: substrate-binding domain-containing protein [Pseudomonadota bacterium]